MTALMLARWQFGVTSLPSSSRRAPHRQRRLPRMTTFFGKLFLINFGLGVVTGIVQEFQFGMNWSQYSRYVGAVFGPPLAIDGLMAFVLESTFLGLWIFGKSRLFRRLHLATI